MALSYATEQQKLADKCKLNVEYRVKQCHWSESQKCAAVMNVFYETSNIPRCESEKSKSIGDEIDEYGNNTKSKQKWDNKQHGTCIYRDVSKGVTSDTNSQGFQRDACGKQSVIYKQDEAHKRSQFSRIYSTKNGWTDFPTQSHVCNGNDGIPSRLDSITIPKWRTESIKAGGNAIVPQVAYQIFKAINEFENLCQ